MIDPRDINRDIADAEALDDSDPGEEHAVSYDEDDAYYAHYDDDDGIRNGHDRPEEVRGER